MEIKTFSDVIDIAIKREESTAELYIQLSQKKGISEEMRKTFELFAKQELGHKAYLLRIKNTGVYTLAEEPPIDLKLDEYLKPIEMGEHYTYQDALIIAMKIEKASYNLYNLLAHNTSDSKVKELFKRLSYEELHHKHIFEQEYDRLFLSEN